ncbi:AMP-binding protein [Corynebacterium sp. 335C]
MKSEINVAPSNSFAFEAKAFAQTLGPLLRTGAFWMTPKMVPGVVDCLYRWKFAISSLVSLGAVRYPDRLALVDDEGELTYTELRDLSISLSEAMMDLGLAEHTPFGVMARNGRGIIMPMAAKSFVGAEILLMNTGASSAQIEGLIKQNGMKFLFIDEEFLGQLPDDMHGCRVVVSHMADYSTRDHLPEGALVMRDLAEAGGSSDIQRKPEQGRIIIMSSGTTGLPKGILRDEPKTPSPLGAVAERIPWRRNMVIHQSATMFHAWGWANVIIAMGTGATIVTQRNFDGAPCIDQCRKYGVDGMISAAIWLRNFRDALKERPELQSELGPFDFLVSSGNAIPPWLVTELTERFGPVVHNFYGSTEAGICTIATGEEMARNPETSGRPALGVRTAILDEKNRPVKTGEIGRLHTAMAMTFNGYLSAEDSFRTVDGMFEIGDLAKQDEDGYIYICGRSDDMIIKGGENVFPREVEELVGSIHGTGDVFARGVQDDDLIASLHVYVVRADNEDGRGLSEEGIKKFVADRLAAWSVPDEVFFVDSLPRNPAGKVVLRELDAQMEARGK